MQVCLPVFKLELIWHPVGPRRAVGLPRAIRRKQRGKTAAGQGPWLPPVGVTDTPTSAPRGTRIQLQRRADCGGGRGLQAVGPAPPQSPAPSPSRDAPAQLPGKPGAEALGAIGKRWPLPPWLLRLGSLSPSGGPESRSRCPHTAAGPWEALEGWRPQNLNCCRGLEL